MKEITIYVNYAVDEFDDPEVIKKRDSIVNEMMAIINLPRYSLGYKVIIKGTDENNALNSIKSDQCIDYPLMGGNRLFCLFISDQKREGLKRYEFLEMHARLGQFSIEFIEFICQEMKLNKKFQDVFDGDFSENLFKLRTIIELSNNKSKNEAARLRLCENSQPNHVVQNKNTLFATTPKNHYFKKAAAEFCIATILCGTGALLFTIEPVSASILIALGLLLYAATLYHALSGCVEPKNNEPVALTA